ncbi:GTP-binding protein ryH1, putative [Entamoeba invadens IP1]|uniref:GTP-binding protein ryH1, putative n=1 Tax=Entamoeba invadens IP1 TaxID=370355 RepID=UPI0002C3EE21|nr:GTP-binding protein ryH1, putative [Entamoeba invadens IP1]ELP90492.1 GTP-binding protein ryH1, putative [Entamoeba invadens IP1]|eukprot:XP_004257263.1 GTP-binding protein ryH1, putative [Entamoeba invadens IP1]
MSMRGVKIVLVGDSYSGKTSLIQRFVTEEFVDSHLSTVVSSCFQKVVHLKDRDMSVNIWDTAGQERFRSLAANFFREAQGIIICYDVTSPKSLTSVPDWIQEKDAKGEDNVVWMLLGCKCDDQIKVDEEKVEELVKKHNVMHMRCSAKTGENVVQTFTALCEKINEILQDPTNDLDDDTDIITTYEPVTLGNSTSSQNKQNKCC